MRKKLAVSLAIIASIMTFGLWHHYDSLHEQISVRMDKNLTIEAIERNLGENPKFIAKTTIDVQHIPVNQRKEYEIKIRVKAYDSPQFQKEITNNIQYVVMDEVQAINGTHPIQIEVDIMEDAKAYQNIHMVVSADIQKVTI